MAEISKLSVEKTLSKIRADDARQSSEAAFNDKIDVLNEEIARMRAQRLRLERHQRKHHQERHATPTARNVIRLGSWYRAYSGFCAHKPVALRRGLGTKPGCIAAATLRTGSRPPIASRNGARIDSFS